MKLLASAALLAAFFATMLATPAFSASPVAVAICLDDDAGTPTTFDELEDLLAEVNALIVQACANIATAQELLQNPNLTDAQRARVEELLAGSEADKAAAEALKARILALKGDV